jgi:hypothetical protein
MTVLGDRLAKLEEPMTFDNGKTLAFTIVTTTGKRLRVNCSLIELGDIFSFLGQIAEYAAKQQGSELHQTTADLAPIPASGIAFAAGRTADETLLVMRLSGFDMAFAIPNDGLARLADDIARIARTLSVGDAKPQ